MAFVPGQRQGVSRLGCIFVSPLGNSAVALGGTGEKNAGLSSGKRGAGYSSKLSRGSGFFSCLQTGELQQASGGQPRSHRRLLTMARNGTYRDINKVSEAECANWQ